MICAKYCVKLNSFIWKWSVASKTSPFVKSVSSLFQEGSMSVNILDESLKVVVGSGDRVAFSTDVWCDGLSLKQSLGFLRCMLGSIGLSKILAGRLGILGSGRFN